MKNNLMYQYVRLEWLLEDGSFQYVNAYNVYIAGCLASGGSLILQNEKKETLLQVPWNSIECIRKVLK